MIIVELRIEMPKKGKQLIEMNILKREDANEDEMTIAKVVGDLYETVFTNILETTPGKLTKIVEETATHE